MLPPTLPAPVPAAALRRRRVRVAALALTFGFAAAACGVDVGEGTVTAAEGGSDSEETTTTAEQTTTTAEKTTTTAEETTTTTERPTTTTTRPPTTTTVPIEVFDHEIVDEPTGIRWRMDDTPAAQAGATIFGPMRSYESSKTATIVMVAQDGGWTYDDFMAQLPAVAPDRTDGIDRWVGSFRAHRFHMTVEVDGRETAVSVMAVDVGGRLVVVLVGTDKDRLVFADLLVDLLADEITLG